MPFVSSEKIDNIHPLVVEIRRQFKEDQLFVSKEATKELVKLLLRIFDVYRDVAKEQEERHFKYLFFAALDIAKGCDPTSFDTMKIIAEYEEFIRKQYVDNNSTT